MNQKSLIFFPYYYVFVIADNHVQRMHMDKAQNPWFRMEGKPTHTREA